jgi:hypothetical protein
MAYERDVVHLKGGLHLLNAYYYPIHLYPCFFSHRFTQMNTDGFFVAAGTKEVVIAPTGRDVPRVFVF